MARYLFSIWGITEVATGLFLLEGIPGRREIFHFLLFHALSILLAMILFLVLTAPDRKLRPRLMTRPFLSFLFCIAVIPLAGPLSVVVYGLFLRLYVLPPVRPELYNPVISDFILVMNKRLEVRSLPVTEALLNMELDREESLRIVEILDDLPWSAVKSGILKYMIRLSPYQNVVFTAINLLNTKLDHILGEISALEKEPGDAGTFARVAMLYHEICYLDLSVPVMKSVYLDKACATARRAWDMADTEENALRAIKYLLEANRLDEARSIYREIARRGEDTGGKWLAYQLEMAVMGRDIAEFEAVYASVQQENGVYVSPKVKMAGRAWRKALTSAWL